MEVETIIPHLHRTNNVASVTYCFLISPSLYVILTHSLSYALNHSPTHSLAHSLSSHTHSLSTHPTPTRTHTPLHHIRPHPLIHSHSLVYSLTPHSPPRLSPSASLPSPPSSATHKMTVTRESSRHLWQLKC